MFEQLRTELGYADYLGALQKYRTKHPRAQRLLCMSDFLINYPFAERLFPRCPQGDRACPAMGPCGHSLGRRRRFSTAQDQSLRIEQCGLQAGADLCAQGAGT